MESCLGFNVYSDGTVRSFSVYSGGLVTLFTRPDLETPWKHEQGSEMMFDYLVAHNNIEIEEADTKFVKALIAGEPAKCDPYACRFSIYACSYPS